jgi:hypothetical protein
MYNQPSEQYEMNEAHIPHELFRRVESIRNGKENARKAAEKEGWLAPIVELRDYQTPTPQLEKPVTTQQFPLQQDMDEQSLMAAQAREMLADIPASPFTNPLFEEDKAA